MRRSGKSIEILVGFGWPEHSRAAQDRWASIRYPARGAFRRVLVERVVVRDDRFASHLLNDAWLSPDGFPANRPSTLISSSRSSQWMPTPRPIRRQRFRSADDACDKRGYHPSGTEILRPSLRSTLSVSSETATFSTKGISISIAEVLIPRLHKNHSAISHQSLNSRDLNA